MMSKTHKRLGISIFTAGFLACSMVYAQELKPFDMLKAIDQLPTGSQAELERLCGNILDPVREQRYALQVAELEELQAKVQERIDLLEAKRA